AAGASGSSSGGAGASGAAAGMNAAGAAGSVVAGSGAAGAAGGGAGMGSAGSMAGAGATMGPLTLTSTAVKNGEMLPKKHRCEMFMGPGGASPPLSWSGGPAAKSYAVTLHDLTANLMHWTLYDIPAATTSLPEGVPVGAMPATPMGAKQTPNQLAGMTGPGYFGPCGGSGRNMYEFAVYALDVATLPDLGANPTAAQARMAITMHTLPMGKATLGVTSSSSDP
ncbi:MAG TPA: YbhB/YbcL family Raf kinase inhibitor-like protein, partial [Polyangiales bacterium]|nr:YbhB/YbcL family Raf kinase inhibitor-like protein [Polyangiales bacterium]